MEEPELAADDGQAVHGRRDADSQQPAEQRRVRHDVGRVQLQSGLSPDEND